MVNRELVDGILTFRNLGEGQGVVVVKFGRRDLRRNAFVGETGIDGAKVIGLFPNIRDLGSVELDHDGPDVGGTVAFGDGHELTLDDTSVSLLTIASHHQLNIGVGSHLERQILTSDTEHTVAGREVQNGHSVVEGVAIHGEVEGFHPAAGRANAHVQRVDDFVFTVHVLDVKVVFHGSATASATTAATSVGEGGLGQEVTLRGGNIAQAAVAVALDGSASNSLTSPTDGLVVTRARQIETNEQVTAIVGVRRAEIDRHSASGTIKGARVNDGSTSGT